MSDQWRQLILFPSSGEQFPLSMDNARLLLVKAVMVGNVHITKHFKERREERGFSTVDVERVIRHGEFACDPEYSRDFGNWLFRIAGKCENRNFEARVALDWNDDLELPTIVYITGICKPERAIKNVSKGKTVQGAKVLRVWRTDAR